MSVRPTVAVLFGGRSLEHDVSVVSGLQVLHALDPSSFTPMPVYIDQSSRWWVGDDLWYSQTFKGGDPDRSRLTEVTLSTGFGSSVLIPLQNSNLAIGVEIVHVHGTHVDVFVPVLHGTFGEDGSIQGLLDVNGCAYVGSGVLPSAIGMNKRVTKILVAQAGVPVLPWLSCERGVLDKGASWLHELPSKAGEAFGWPVIVKPCNLGSSAGVSIAANPEELVAGVLKVFEFDLEALIEPFIKNRLELNVAVAGLDEPVASVTEMPVTSQESLLSFSDKYKREGRKSVGSSQGMASALRLLDPDDLPVEMRLRAQQLATKAFAELGCEGISRVDFLIDADDGELYFNEINTQPGSFAFYLWSAAPHYWTLTELMSKLINRAQRLQAIRRGLHRRPPAELKLL